MSVTLQDLRTIVYDILREEETDSWSYTTTLVDLFLNSAQQKICNGRVINPLNKEEARKWVLPFLNTDKFYSTIGSTSLTATTSEWATTLTVDSTANFDSTWTIYIWGDIITYTWKTSTTFTGVSGVSFARTSGKRVYPVYTLPTDYSSVINVIYNDRYKLEWKNYDDIFEMLNSYKGTYYNRWYADSYYDSNYMVQPFYTIKDNAYLILFQLDNNDYVMRMRYEKLPTTMTAITDTATISNDIYAKTTIPYLAVAEMLYNRGEEWRAGEIINFAMGQIKEMYNYYNNTNHEKISGVQYKSAKWGKINV